MVPSGRALSKDCGLEELRWARALCILRLANRMVEILTVHVEDSMFFGVAGTSNVPEGAPDDQPEGGR